MGLDTLLLVTGVDQVYVDFNKSGQRALGQVSVAELRQHLPDGQFPAGSMGPKVSSAIDFIENGGKRAIITSIECLCEALNGAAGTIVTAE